MIEIGDGDSDGGTVDAVAGDEGALKAEFGIKRDLARVRYGIAFDVEVGGRIAAHGRKGAMRDMIAPHDDIAGAKDIDGIAVLTGTAGAVGNILDAVAGNDGAVLAFLATPNLNAVIGRARDIVAQDNKPARIEGMDRGVHVAEVIAGDFAVRGEAMECRAAGTDKFAIGNLQRSRVFEMDHTAAPRRGAIEAVKLDSRQRDVGSAGACKQRAGLGAHETRCAPYPNELGGGRKIKVGKTIDSGRENERGLAAGRGIDGGLRFAALVVGTARTKSEMGGVESQGGKARR